MVSCLMGDSTALASAIVRCCLRIAAKRRKMRLRFAGAFKNQPIYVIVSHEDFV